MLGSTDVTRCAGETQHNLMLVESGRSGVREQRARTRQLYVGRGNHVGRTLHLETCFV